MLTAELTEILQPPQNGTLLIITIGNSLRSDDGIGPYIAEKLKPAIKSMEHHIQTYDSFQTTCVINGATSRRNVRVSILNAGNKPENIIDAAVSYHPEKTIIIDAANFGGYPGELRLITEDKIPDNALSTHTFPLKIISRIIAQDTKREVLFLGIQSKTVEYGEILSPEVKETADEIIKFFNEA